MKKKGVQLQFDKDELKSPTPTEKAKLHTDEKKLSDKISLDETKQKPSSKLKKDTDLLPSHLILQTVDKELEDTDDNAGTDALRSGLRQTDRITSHMYQEFRKRKTSEKSETRKTEQDTPETENVTKPEPTAKKQTDVAKPTSNSIQKQQIKKEYAKAYTSESVSETTSAYSIKDSIKKKVSDVGSKVTEYFKSNGNGLVLILAVILLLIFIILAMSSGSVLIEGSVSGPSFTTYLSEDKDMISAFEYYSDLQSDLDYRVRNYESTHDYDEYHYTLGEITEDPYGITSLLSAEYGTYEYPNVQSYLDKVFAKQYMLKERITKETRYRLVVDYVLVTEPNNQDVMITYWKRVESYEPYEYRICHLTLSVRSTDSIAKEILSEDKYSIYEIYTETKGNREDLF